MDRMLLTPQICQMPAELAKALVEALGKVHILGKSETNKFAKYNFVSIDKFLEMTNKICSECGIIVLTDELECEIVPGGVGEDGKHKSAWMRTLWEFTLVHSSGQTARGGRRTVIVPATGAQSTGASQSYALKQFFRALLQIPTGDKDDPDFQAHGEVPQDKPKRMSVYQAKKEIDWPAIEKSIRECPTEAKLMKISERIDEHDKRGSWPESYISSAIELINARAEELAGGARKENTTKFALLLSTASRDDLADALDLLNGVPRDAVSSKACEIEEMALKFESGKDDVESALELASVEV